MEIPANRETRPLKRNAADRAFTVRAWRPGDDPALVAILRAQIQLDPGWPPAYARGGDLGKWLGAPATLGRWVAVDSREEPVGHVGIAPVAPGERAELWTTALGCDISALAEVCRNLVEPGMRRTGVSAGLTRVALRAAIDAGRVPVAAVLQDRQASLAMMLSAGWRVVGGVVGSSGRELSVMIPGPRVLAAAQAGRAA